MINEVWNRAKDVPGMSVRELVDFFYKDGFWDEVRDLLTTPIAAPVDMVTASVDKNSLVDKLEALNIAMQHPYLRQLLRNYQDVIYKLTCFSTGRIDFPRVVADTPMYSYVAAIEYLRLSGFDAYVSYIGSHYRVKGADNPLREELEELFAIYKTMRKTYGKDNDIVRERFSSKTYNGYGAFWRLLESWYN